MRGFTLIELLVVFAVLGILTVMGISAYSVYNSSQSLQVGSADVLNILTTAKSRAIAQVKPAECGTNSLGGYIVTVTRSGADYSLQVRCGGNTYTLLNRQLPPNVTFSSSSATSITFNALTGVPAAAGAVGVTAGGKTRTLTIQSTGNIITN